MRLHLLIMTLVLPALMQAQTHTVYQKMESIRQTHGVFFVYDASLNLNIPYRGEPFEGKTLNKSLRMLFDDTSIKYKRHGRNIMLWSEVHPQKKTVRKSKVNVRTATLGKVQELPDVTVTGSSNSPVLTTQTGKRTITADDINTEFALLSSPDLIKTLQQISGVSNGIELSSGLLVHGGNSDENLFLLDGTPIYQTNHSLGLFSAFNTDVIESADFYKSDFPARYSGRVSSITDVTTRDGDMQKTKGMYSIGLIDGRVQVEGPLVKDRTSLNVALRRSWIDLLMKPIQMIVNSGLDDGEEFMFGYVFYDLNAKLTHRLNNGGTVWLSLYNGRDSYSVHDKCDDLDSYVTDSYSKFRWGNATITIGANLKPWRNVSATVRAIGTYSHSLYNFDEDDTYHQNDGIVRRLSLDLNHSNTRMYDAGVKADLLWTPLQRHHVRFGGSYTHHIFRPQSIMQAMYFDNGGDKIDTASVNERNSTVSDETSLYIEDEMQVTPRLLANIGSSYTMTMVDGKVYSIADPRIALKYQLYGWCSLKLSYTKMSQTVHRMASSFLEMPTDFWVPTTADIHPTQSQQLAGGIYTRRGNWTVTLEGYYKTTSHLLQYKSWLGLQPPATRWDKNIAEGRGRAYGVEFDAAYRTPRLSASLAYTLSWSRRNFPELHSRWFSDQFDNRHKLNLSARYKINDRIAVYAAWTYRSGNRITMPTGYALTPSLPEDAMKADAGYIYTEPNNFVLPAYHRLDLGADFRHTTRHGHTRIWNVSLYNAYCHMNTMYVDLKANKDGTFSAKSRGYIPVIPSVSYTIQF